MYNLEDVESAQLAEDLAQYAKDNNIVGQTKDIDADGNVSFTELDLGLYLLVQDTAASGYDKVASFLVSVPMMEDGVYVYDIDASPKVELEQTESTEPTEPTTPTTPTTPTSPTLPQTGQLNWPIPVLVVLGLSMFSLGWMLRFGKKTGYER